MRGHLLVECTICPSEPLWISASAGDTFLISCQTKKGEIGSDSGDQCWCWRDRGKMKPRVGKDVNPICHVLTVLIRGLC